MAEPCVRCGTEGGVARFGAKQPSRYGGAKYGWEGPLCHDCYFAERAAAMEEQDFDGRADLSEERVGRRIRAMTRLRLYAARTGRWRPSPCRGPAGERDCQPRVYRAVLPGRGHA